MAKVCVVCAAVMALGGCAAVQGPSLGPTDKAEIIQAVAAVKTDVAANVRADLSAHLEAVGVKLSSVTDQTAGRDVNSFDYWAIRAGVVLFGLVVLAVIAYIIYDRWADRRNGKKSHCSG